MGARGTDVQVLIPAPPLQESGVSRLDAATAQHRGVKYFCLNLRATLTRLISTGTSTNGPITAAKASPDWRPKTATATAMASSKLLLAAVNDRVVEMRYPAPALADI